jgi:hypothetical protein
VSSPNSIASLIGLAVVILHKMVMETFRGTTREIGGAGVFRERAHLFLSVSESLSLCMNPWMQFKSCCSERATRERTHRVAAIHLVSMGKNDALETIHTSSFQRRSSCTSAFHPRCLTQFVRTIESFKKPAETIVSQSHRPWNEK